MLSVTVHSCTCITNMYRYNAAVRKHCSTNSSVSFKQHLGFPWMIYVRVRQREGFSLIPLWVLFIYFIFFIFYRQHEYNICAWEDKCSLFAKQQNCRRAALVSLPGVVPLWVVWTERCKQTLVKKFLWDFVSNNSMPQRTKWWVQASYW